MSWIRLFLIITIILSVSMVGLALESKSEHVKTPAMFIFGDSLVDAGNNNNLRGNGKANYYPYGKDFPNGEATGRFCNGKLVVDELAGFMGLSLPISYASAGDNIKHGVNFGSAGSGLLPQTGAAQIGRIPMAQQVFNFQQVHARLYETLGDDEASKLISKSIFYITDGVNDVAGALMRNPIARSETAYVATTLSTYVEDLYNMGARKFVVTNVLPIGCEPIIAFMGSCNPSLNQLAASYNEQLQNQLNLLRSRLSDALIIYANLYGAMLEVIENPSSYGFANVHQPCYPGRLPFCANASHYAFWDYFHPTEALNHIVADKFWNGSQHYAYPTNIKELAHDN